MTLHTTWAEAYGAFSPAARVQEVYARDVSGGAHIIPVADTKLFLNMFRTGGSHPDNWYDTKNGSLVRHGALVSVRALGPVEADS